MKKILIFLTNFFMSIGITALISSIILYWFIHGDYERYIWIIKGPFPFSSFGGGPFQMLMYASLFIIGAVFIIVSILINKNVSKE